MTTEHPAEEAAPAAPSGRTPSRRYMARRDAIIASAIREMNRHGVRGMTLGDVAARLDLVPTGVIYYFRNKEDLAAAAFERSIGRIRELAEAARGHPTERERVQVFIDLFIGLQQRIELGEAEPLTVFNDVRALNCDSVNQAYVGMFRTVRALLDRRDNRSRADLNGRTHLLISALTFVNAWIYTWRVEDYPRIGQRIASILLDGIPRGGNVPGPRLLDLQPAGDEIDEGSAEHFLRAATQLINDEGYHGASVDRISSRLNVTKGAFYHYNATKDDLVVACFQRTFDVLWRAIDAAEAAGGEGLVQQRRHALDLRRAGFVADGVLAHHRAPQSTVADEEGGVEADLAFEAVEVLGKGVPVPLDALFESRQRHAFDHGHHATDVVGVARRQRGQRETAVAADDRGHTV